MPSTYLVQNGSEACSNDRNYSCGTDVPLAPSDEAAYKCGARWKVAAACLAVGGLLLVVAGVVVPIVLNDVMQSRLDHQLVLTDSDSPGYASFVDSRSTDGSPFHRNIYFFNLTNPAEVLLGAPPRLTEHGPYAFRRDTVHQQPSFSADSTQITATPWTIFSFVAEESVGKLSDRFTSVNAVFQRFAYLARNDTLAKLALYFVYDNRPDVNYTDQDILFSTRPLGEFLFGFLDPDL
eukprot:777818_1